MNLRKKCGVFRKNGALFLFVLITALFPLFVNASTSPVDIWWPIEGAHLTGVQSFRALQKDLFVEEYDMYWQVDGGDLVRLDTSYNDYAHKVATVDFSNWNWKGKNSYQLTFKTKNKSGFIIGEESINIYVNSNSNISTNSPPVTVDVLKNIAVWWPTESTHISGVLPFKALLEGENISNYSLSWQVDGGTENPMSDNHTDYPYKESIVDVSNWNWNSTGSYLLTFVARSNATGLIIGKANRSIYVDKSHVSVPATSNSNPLFGKKLYVDKNSPAVSQVNQWLNTRPTDAKIMRKIAENPSAVWLGSWSSDLATRDSIAGIINSAKLTGTIPTFVLYNIPSRDCGGYSFGGTNDPNGYISWINMVASALGKNHSIVILEPDALAQITCLSQAGQNDRFRLLSEAVNILKTKTSATVYLDAGHADWVPSDEIANRLKKSGIEKADGFSLNVSNFNTTDTNISFGKKVSSQLMNKHFVIDTSRNGINSNNGWCNPDGKALGQQPTTLTGEPLVDAYLWIKVPGESDGECNGGPSAGSWWSNYALGLASRANW